MGIDEDEPAVARIRRNGARRQQQHESIKMRNMNYSITLVPNKLESPSHHS
jgi:hypothetical protein